jgi:L-asparaginase/N4-(beta-N-acetylglucosaminyl)-L-asparaginase
MLKRKDFLRLSALAGSGLFAAPMLRSGLAARNLGAAAANGPIVISTWDHGMPANAAAWEILGKNGRALDAVEQGVMVPEADPKETSVGFGGLPDRTGHVTLDACIMDENSNCGSVAFLENIMHPISVARKVMEDTPHVMLVGEGAYEFAISKGFPKQNLLTAESKAAWKEWMKEQKYKTEVNRENHDTIGMVAMDAAGNLSGACTTSGMAYKLRGRVGDSPIIGAGLFVDNEVGAATATGLGEAVIRIAGSHTVVELMRQGYTPEAACQEAVERIVRKHKSIENLQVGFLALNKKGEYGAYSVYPGFTYAVRTGSINEMMKSKSHKSSW